MENNNQNSNPDPKTFKLYTGKAPVLIQIVGGAMYLSGIGLIIIGIPMILSFGLGILVIILGVLYIKYGKAIFRMEKKGYKMGLILQGAFVFLWLVSIGLAGFEKLSATDFLTLSDPLFLGASLYAYRTKFIN